MTNEFINVVLGTAGTPRDRRWASKETQAASAEMAVHAEVDAAAILANAEEKKKKDGNTVSTKQLCG